MNKLNLNILDSIKFFIKNWGKKDKKGKTFEKIKKYCKKEKQLEKQLKPIGNDINNANR